MSETNSSRWATRLASLDANLLVALDALLQEANVTRAAKRVAITQSAMSQTLSRLRDQFDDPILVRVGRTMQPTPFAESIKARLHRAISELEAVVRDRSEFDPRTVVHRFVVGTVDYLSMLLLPPLQQAVADRAPHVDLAVHALDAGSNASKLEEGIVDLYLGIPGDTERALETHTLFHEGFTVVVRPDHPLCQEPLTPDAYVSWPHVHVSPRREAGSIIDRGLADVGLNRRVAIEVPYFALVPKLVESSDLVATVPERIGRLFEAEHGLALLPVPVTLPEIEVCMAWHPSFAREPALVWLRELVAEVARTI